MMAALQTMSININNHCWQASSSSSSCRWVLVKAPAFSCGSYDHLCVNDSTLFIATPGIWLSHLCSSCIWIYYCDYINHIHASVCRMSARILPGYACTINSSRHAYDARVCTHVTPSMQAGNWVLCVHRRRTRLLPLLGEARPRLALIIAFNAFIDLWVEYELRNKLRAGISAPPENK